MQIGPLEKLEPLTQDLDKLEHLRVAVAHHLYEEGNWFIDLRDKAPLAEQNRFTARYQEKFTRYVDANVEGAGVRKQAVMS